MTEEILDLQRKLSVANGGRDRELATAKQNVQRLQVRVDQLEGLTGKFEDDGQAAAELSIVQKDLSKARKKEAEYLEREAAQKESHRDLKQKSHD